MQALLNVLEKEPVTAEVAVKLIELIKKSEDSTTSFFRPPSYALPIAKESPEGQRLGRALAMIKEAHPDDTGVTMFEFEFWHPERDTEVAWEAFLNGDSYMEATMAMTLAGKYFVKKSAG